ncbi:MAG TPA: rubrerythrin family protein [Candidatus Merdenecus merdavium]|nr:rubrerythrin family protein [Candidatus Merdenecus merdavium]
MDFKTSKTYQNLQQAMNTKSDTAVNYMIYGETAKAEGYIEIGNVYDEYASQEREHVKILMRIMGEGELPNTSRNLRESADIEDFFWQKLFISYADTAKEEGFDDIAKIFEGIASADRQHGFVFNQLEKNVDTNRVFCKNIQEVWICIKCGNVFWGYCAPDICPLCGYPQGYYRIDCTKY